jgi:malonate-semialdehyde dehydrogenase (acetylating)/methylmalonate-semialdehyde dehydrogenase
LFDDMAVHGKEGVCLYPCLKTVTARWPTGIRAGAEYVMPTMRRGRRAGVGEHR